MPANFPPAECEADSLSGMGTPDMMGTTGTFTFFTDDPAEKRTTVPAGKIVQVNVSNGRAALRIEGPPNGFRRDNAAASVEMIAHVDPTAQAARFDLGDQQVVLRQGEWSEWLHADFRLLPLVKSASGILRIYLQQAHPYLRVYVSPVNIDPASPELPISTPASFSRQLSDALGPFLHPGNRRRDLGLPRRAAEVRTSFWCRATRSFPTACACSATNWRISRTACCFTTSRRPTRTPTCCAASTMTICWMSTAPWMARWARPWPRPVTIPPCWCSRITVSPASTARCT